MLSFIQHFKRSERRRLSTHEKRRIRRDKRMLTFVTLSGWLILLTFASLIWQLLVNSWPLLQTPKATMHAQWTLPDGQVLFVGDMHKQGLLVMRDQVDPQQQNIPIANDYRCDLRFYQLTSDSLKQVTKVNVPCKQRIKVFEHQGQLLLANLSAKGILRLDEIIVAAGRLQRHAISSFRLVKEAQMAQLLEWQVTLSDASLTLNYALTANQGLNWFAYQQALNNPFEYTKTQLGRSNKVLPIGELGLLLNTQANTLSFSNFDGELIQQFSFNRPIKGFFSLASGRAFLVIEDDNRLSHWALTNASDQQAFALIHAQQLAQTFDALSDYGVSQHSLLYGEKGELNFYNSVSAELFATQAFQQDLSQMFWYQDSLYAIDESALYQARISGLNGFISWKMLFQANWYEGYSRPEYIWQSSAATDIQQHKYSLIPLLVGSFKAALLALTIAIPLAISAAIYTAYFASTRMRNWLKPAIEMLEAVPSVLIGFIAAVWLNPIADNVLLPVILCLFALPFFLFIFSFVQVRLLTLLPLHLQKRWEFNFAILFIVLSFVWVLFNLNWLSQAVSEAIGWQESKSILVVAIALGVAIAPSIYSIAEDAIHGVPQSLRLASAALGASRLQTLHKVVLKVSLPGIFSAITLGFGRAFGETIILLMVTGNTPIAQWDLISSIRSLTANLAIELPEAQPGSDLYHVLFFTALLLFVFTFLLNTLAEFLKMWMRKSYAEH